MTATPNSDADRIRSMRCPKCFYNDGFLVTADIKLMLSRTGSKATGDFKWSDQYPCKCPSCGHEATASDFCSDAPPTPPPERKPAKRNTGELKGMACPKCGSNEPFEIRMFSDMVVFDKGASRGSDAVHNDRSRCKCLKCFYIGQVGDFKAATALGTEGP